MDIFTHGDVIVRWDGWIDLPQQMGKVRLNSEYIAFDPDTIFMDGVVVPEEKTVEDDEDMEDS